MGTSLDNEWIPMLVEWKVWSFAPREEKVFCKDERSYNALIGLLERDGVKYKARRVYTIYESEETNEN